MVVMVPPYTVLLFEYSTSEKSTQRSSHPHCLRRIPFPSRNHHRIECLGIVYSLRFGFAERVRCTTLFVSTGRGDIVGWRTSLMDLLSMLKEARAESEDKSEQPQPSDSSWYLFDHGQTSLGGLNERSTREALVQWNVCVCQWNVLRVVTECDHRCRACS
jgi:hypothetical protein